MKAIAFIVALAASPAMAQECYGTPDTRAYIIKHYKAWLVFSGTFDGKLVEIWMNDQGEWVQLFTFINGKSCFVAFGLGAKEGGSA